MPARAANDRSPSRTGAAAGRAPSLADVARLAGVSTQTVSRVSTGSTQVRPETRAVVLEAMCAVGYAPNAAARALRSGTFGTFGVIVHQISRTGESRSVEAIVAAARRHGYAVTLVDVEHAGDSDVEAAVARLQNQLIDGLIVLRHETETPVHLRVPDTLPLVVSDARFVGEHATVGADQLAGTAAAVEHLLGLGHVTVHHVGGPPTSNPAQVRRTGWVAALEAHGRQVPPLTTGDWTPASGYRAGTELVARIHDGEPITAVFSANDEMAAGLLLALTRAGLSVPGDVSVIGFDNIPLSAYLQPPLTTVEQDFAAMGEALVEMLIAQVRRRGAGRLVPGGPSGEAAPAEATRRVVPANLIVRESTAPPRR
ncbi:LacI family DNA-binding transcriptional regulator [Miniimonas sp. S16]|uniref:LacI family DNA-binding transcriptional regulator n=1 Tax=Miniimonas sp. S16 TaxID=2171623 RepID=UPI000D527FAF|nr:LacI family DNA-binding transcriptional regulator [Miniimonas sp. S16]